MSQPLSLPAQLGYGRVRWTAVAAVADTPIDVDVQPDPVPVTGVVTFTPSASVLLAHSATPVTVMATPIVCQLLDGVLRDENGNDSVYLVATDSPGVTPTDWTWMVQYKLDGGMARGSFSFSLPTGSTVDLTDVAPVGASNGVPITRGLRGYSAYEVAVQNGFVGDINAWMADLQGDQGIQGPSGTIASATAEGLAAGASPTVTLGGTPQNRTMAFGIPKGDKGDQGIVGPVGPMPTIAGTSATSLTPGTGAKAFTTQANLNLVVGQYVRVQSVGTPADYFAGQITAYNSTTGAMTVNGVESAGATARTDWAISITGTRGATGNTGAVPVISGTSTTSFTPGTGSKVFVTQASVPGFTVGQYVRIASTAAPGEYMAGNITAYTTTSLTVNVVEFAGTGVARTAWNISLSGPIGPQGPVGAGAPGATTIAQGSVMLAGDLGGTADAPFVTGGTHHTHTSTQVGLGNVDNTSDANKPVSTAQATAINARIAATEKGAANGVATLGADSKLPTAQLPDLAVVDFLGTVASQAAMLALVGQKGDWAIRSDSGTVWIITGSTPSVIGSWTQVSYPAAPVSSVAGKTGVVTLVKGDVGLGNVDNTSDAAKPISTATQTALDGKMPHPGADPNADRLVFWDDSAGAFVYLTLGTGLSITGTTITGTATPPAASETVAGIVELATQAEALAAASTTLAITPDDLAGVPVVVRYAGSVPNRPATPRPVHWILPTSATLALNGTTAGGTAAAVADLDIISRWS